MNGRAVKGGFTLVEILVAIAIIVAIVSMVYGSYLAASRSAEVCKAKMALSKDAQRALQQMARQIRCAYAGPSESVSQRENKESESMPNYFSGNSDDRRGEILHLVTTNAIFKDGGVSDGLFEVTYQFDQSKGLLSISQQRFTGTSKNISSNSTWQPLAGNIESVQLQFFDGKRWLNKWDFRDQTALPRAVKINFIFQDENYRQCNYTAIAYICCQRNQGGTLVSVNKQ